MTTATANPIAPQTTQQSKFVQARRRADAGGAKVTIVTTPPGRMLTPEAKDELVAEFRQFIESIDTPFIHALTAEVFTFHSLYSVDGTLRGIPSGDRKAAFWARQRRRDEREAVAAQSQDGDVL